MFGDAASGGSRRRGSRGADLEYELDLTFDEAAQGTAKTIIVPRREVCSECHGEGGTRATCATCGGSGQVRQSSGFFVLARTCPKCQGQGGTITKACPNCRGSGRVTTERRIQVKVPAGIETGMRLRVPGEGEGGTRSRGDLYVLAHVRPHPLFQRDGGNLILDYPASMSQAALGTEIELPTMNGKVSMKIPAGTQSGTVFRVRGKGLPDVHGGGRGDLMVRALVETPSNLSGPQRRQLEELGRTLGETAHPSRRSFLAKVKDLLKR